MKRYGFWIIPENDFYQELKKLIRKYSKKYSSPSFVPHMTIHGSVASTDKNVIEDVLKVASKIKPFEVEVGEVEFSTTYFQCIFARMKTSAIMLNTHLALKKQLKDAENNVFMPHASLVYGDFDMKTREQIVSEIKLKGNKFLANKITIIRANSRDPKDWSTVEHIRFKLNTIQ